MDQEQIPPRKSAAHEQEAKYGEFVSLLARHDQSIRRFIRLLLPTREGVDDVMQETALECWNQFAQFTPRNPEDIAGDFIRWACVIARYKTLSWQRDRARDRLVFRESIVERLAQTSMQELDQREQERTAIQGCLQKLSSEERRLVLSVHSPGESIARIAEESGRQARRLYSQVNYLRKVLLECVRHQVTQEIGHG
ncbi:RNA polymerase ECF-type sigma factor [Planctomycetales bacterium 10988]|nr:RNA polymerase ECF-type sigma factor [Planctomycetales bacterium 10988]